LHPRRNAPATIRFRRLGRLIAVAMVKTFAYTCVMALTEIRDYDLILVLTGLEKVHRQLDL
jgi:hypothetical protein